MIAAVGNNQKGIIGVAPEAKILPVKALDENGQGPVSALAAGIEYAAEIGADVINNSWGCTNCLISPVVEDPVRTAHALGVVVVFSAGNSKIFSSVAIEPPQFSDVLQLPNDVRVKYPAHVQAMYLYTAIKELIEKQFQQG